MITYAMAAERYDGWVKIGQTTGESALKRLAGCQTGNPRKLHIVAWWPADVERLLHDHWKALRGAGEWFALPPMVLTVMREGSGLNCGWVEATKWSSEDVQALIDGDDRSPEVAADFFSYAHGRTFRGVQIAS